MKVSDLVLACGAPNYLSIEGNFIAAQSLLTHLDEMLASSSRESVRVLPDSRWSSTITPLSELRIQATEGPVVIEQAGPVGVLAGGAHELRLLLNQMQTMSSTGPNHHEILRALEEGYAHIDASTHIDLIVTS